MSSLVFKRLPVIMLNKATLLSSCLGSLDVLAPICKNRKGDCRHNSAQWLQAVLSILRLTGDQRGELRKEWSLDCSVFVPRINLQSTHIIADAERVLTGHQLPARWTTSSFLDSKAGTISGPLDSADSTIRLGLRCYFTNYEVGV